MHLVVPASPSAARRTFQSLAPLRDRLAAQDRRVLTTQIGVSEIPAPTGDEGTRAAWMASRLRGMGYDVRLDEAGNVLAGPATATDVAPILVCAHLDTVFPRETPVSVTERGARLIGPGIGDNGRGLAVMLAIAEALRPGQVRTRRPIIFTATTGEEGLGDLRGAKHLFAEVGSSAAGAVVIDGAGDERVVHRALGSRRFRITFRGAGGHSWAAFGTPNAVHAATIAGAKLARLPLPRDPRTTLSIGRIGGGISVNAIPEESWLEIDLRSTSSAMLDRFDTEIRAVALAAAKEESARRAPGTQPLMVTVEVIGSRPCGYVPSDEPLVVAAIEATRLVGRDPELATASTDANVPISLGIPAVAIGGGGRGGEAHTPNEWYENVDGALGVARALTVVCAAAELA